MAELTVMQSFTLLFIGNWKSELLKVVDADQLPVHWGGNATDPDGDPCCKSKVNFELRSARLHQILSFVIWRSRNFLTFACNR